MRSFKEYFQLFLERHSFTKNIMKFDKMINDLKNQIKSIPKIKNGEEFYLDFDKENSILVRLFSKAPKNIENAEYTKAQYYPSDVLIEIYLSNVFEGLSIKAPLQYIKKDFPAELEAVLKHELSHAYEDLVSGVLTYTSPDDTRDSSDFIKYFNSDSEINAYFHEHIPNLIKREPLLRSFYKKGDIRSATLFVINKVKQLPEFEELYDKNKKWFFKTIYTTLDQLMNK